MAIPGAALAAALKFGDGMSVANKREVLANVLQKRLQHGSEALEEKEEKSAASAISQAHAQREAYDWLVKFLQRHKNGGGGFVYGGLSFAEPELGGRGKWLCKRHMEEFVNHRATSASEGASGAGKVAAAAASAGGAAAGPPSERSPSPQPRSQKSIGRNTWI